ncbi:hypothetical protein BpHYR1_045016 [Brachionus plicatilis]|uniref:Uncharacterized protein n=1 Tax=Brachionus plicatilis TaxID=10195 RepID=A0A3M7PUV7_BRAPC|nr:hypothetical protein BpHYR1_045016 [Brachionus plicatilis]
MFIRLKQIFTFFSLICHFLSQKNFFTDFLAFLKIVSSRIWALIFSCSVQFFLVSQNFVIIFLRILNFKFKTLLLPD